MCRLDEEMIENLFGVGSRATASDVKRLATSTATPEKNEILKPRKAHNIVIQLRENMNLRENVTVSASDSQKVKVGFQVNPVQRWSIWTLNNQ